MPLIYMANECLDTSTALKYCEEIQGCFCVRGGQLESFNGVGFLLFTVTLRPPEFVLEQSCDMLFRVFLNTEGSLYQKCLNSRHKVRKGISFIKQLQKIAYYSNFFDLQ